MPRFFIERPVFAWVVAIFIVLAGALSIPGLPVERFPSIAPPSVGIYATYTGASPRTVSDSVIGPIERELSGVKNLLYFESTADNTGSASITATFQPGTDPEMAQIDVQNRLKAVESRLPQAVRQTGVTVEASSSTFLMMVSLSSVDGRLSALDLGDYMARSITEELNRIPGVGRVQSWGSERAMRIWIDPVRLVSYNLGLNDLTNAIQSQNIQIAPGTLGSEPAVPGQAITAPLTARGQLETVEEFAAIVLRSNPDGSVLKLGDVARIELGAQSHSSSVVLNGKVATSVSIQMSPGANAIATSNAVKARMAELARSMPEGMEYSIAYDISPFVRISIEKVLVAFAEAMLLVFLVMFLFLQNIRFTLIPAIVAPIALLGTCAVMLAAGYSINVLTMFGMVLAIGIIVDDAIMVVENVERIMASEGLPPKEATRKAMKEITGAVIGITAVLTAVFIPMAFMSGSVGAIYRQFALSMSVSILFSAMLALSLTPALCATMLKPVPEDHHEKRGFFGWFNRMFERATRRYANWVAGLITRTGRMTMLYMAILGGLAYSFTQLPTSFLPEEDQGNFTASFQLPADATTERTKVLTDKYQAHVASRLAIDTDITIMGWGFSGSGPNTAVSFTTLKDWGERPGVTSKDEVDAMTKAMADTREGTVMGMLPGSIDGLGNSSGFSMRLQDRSDRGYDALMQAKDQLIALAGRSSLVTGVYLDGLPLGTSVRLDIDRQKAEALGVSFNTVSDMLSAAVGSTYVNDFPNRGRLQQVIVQADAPARMQVDDVLKLNVRNSAGGMVPLSELVTPVWERNPMQLVRYNGLPSVNISGNAASGVSSGEAMAEMERLVEQLPQGYAVEWVGQSYQERQAGSQTPMLLALSMFVVFLVLAALYESWSVPISVMLVVPLGIIGAVLAVHLRDMPNDVFFKVGLVTIIGLSAKNAILIVEFAKMLREQGHDLHEAVVEAARLRLRPILMTSLAFALGVVPLMFARDASAETQKAIGTGVFGGMVSATVLAVFFVPVFYVVIVRLFGDRSNRASQTDEAISAGSNSR